MLFAIEDEIRDFCEENGLEFESEGEFNLYIAELNLLEKKAEERGEDFDWQNGALRYYRAFRGRRDEMNAAGEQKHAVSLSAFNEQELPTLPDELIGGILRTGPSASVMTTRCTGWTKAFRACMCSAAGKRTWPSAASASAGKRKRPEPARCWTISSRPWIRRDVVWCFSTTPQSRRR